MAEDSQNSPNPEAHRTRELTSVRLIDKEQVGSPLQSDRNGRGLTRIESLFEHPDQRRLALFHDLQPAVSLGGLNCPNAAT